MSQGFTDSALLVPPSRLGRVLRDQRQHRDLSIAELSDVSELSTELLEDAEQGRARLDEKLLDELASAYQIDVAELAPQRAELVIDLDEGWISSTGRRVKIDRADEADEADVLTRYLALVYTLREVPMGSQIPLRDLDVGVLAHALEAQRNEIERELTGLMNASPGQLEAVGSSLRKRIVVPLAGILVGVTAMGGLVLVKAESSVSVGDEVPVDIGDAVMIANPDAAQTER